MILWIGAGFLYLMMMAIICVFFRGASMYDRSLEEHERQLLSSLVDRMSSDYRRSSEYQEDSSLQMPDAIPSAY